VAFLNSVSIVISQRRKRFLHHKSNLQLEKLGAVTRVTVSCQIPSGRKEKRRIPAPRRSTVFILSAYYSRVSASRPQARSYTPTRLWTDSDRRLIRNFVWQRENGTTYGPVLDAPNNARTSKRSSQVILRTRYRQTPHRGLQSVSVCPIVYRPPSLDTVYILV
jgi:hypothetical protein